MSLQSQLDGATFRLHPSTAGSKRWLMNSTAKPLDPKEQELQGSAYSALSGEKEAEGPGLAEPLTLCLKAGRKPKAGVCFPHFFTCLHCTESGTHLNRNYCP